MFYQCYLVVQVCFLEGGKERGQAVSGVGRDSRPSAARVGGSSVGLALDRGQRHASSKHCCAIVIGCKLIRGSVQDMCSVVVQTTGETP